MSIRNIVDPKVLEIGKKYPIGTKLQDKSTGHKYIIVAVNLDETDLEFYFCLRNLSVTIENIDCLIEDIRLSVMENHYEECKAQC